jgi:3-oxoacid CoA-transferase subunit A
MTAPSSARATILFSKADRSSGIRPLINPRRTAMNKVIASADAAVADIPDGAIVMIGGFGLCGNPDDLIRALLRRGSRNLTIVANNCGIDGKGIGLLLAAGQIRKMISSYVGENRLFEELLRTGRIETELIPQGTLAERIRAGGAGIPAFFTPAGYGTVVAEGKEVREFDGRNYVMERWLRADFALIKGHRGDRMGNIVYRKTARNFNPVMATAARVTIAEVEHVAEAGQISPDAIVTPGIYVQRLVQSSDYEKPVEHRTVRREPRTAQPGKAT